LETGAHAGAVPAVGGDVQTDVEAREGAADNLDAELGMQEVEGMRILMLGFATGLTIGAVFLVYVIMAAAHWFA
jgi:hypothetical protein